MLSSGSCSGAGSLPLEVSYPPRILNPNKKSKHWGPKARAAKTYRFEVYWATKEALQKGWITVPETPRTNVHLIFTPPMETGAVPDDDNMEAAFKAGRDGLALALNRDDRHFTVTREVLPRDPAFKLGKVRIELWPLDDARNSQRKRKAAPGRSNPEPRLWRSLVYAGNRVHVKGPKNE